MAIKSKIENKSEEEIFPCLMKPKTSHRSFVLLFLNEGGDAIAIGGYEYPIGCKGEWDVSAFEKFEGEITLKND